MSLAIKRFALVCAIVALATPALAQGNTQGNTQGDSTQAKVETNAQPSKATTVEFTAVTRLPGLTLQPGTYVFRLGDPIEKQRIVEVYNADGTRKIATLLTVDYAMPLSGDTTTIIFDKTNPPVVRAWYFPGDPIGREFVYTDAEAKMIFATANTPVLVAAWDPDDTTVVGRVEVQTVGQAVGQAARAVGEAVKEVAKDVADVAEDVWDDIEDNTRLVNPTESRKAAERHLDNAERAYGQLTARLDDTQEAPLVPMRAHLEMLEDTFEKNDATWMTHYTAVIAELDRLVPEGPVGTSGRVTLDASTAGALVGIRAHLKAFHAQAMK